MDAFCGWRIITRVPTFVVTSAIALLASQHMILLAIASWGAIRRTLSAATLMGCIAMFYGDVYAAESPARIGSSAIDIRDDGRANNLGSGSSDTDNDGSDWDRTSQESAVPSVGGMETRPKNVAVNFYVKICNCPDAQLQVRVEDAFH